MCTYRQLMASTLQLQYPLIANYSHIWNLIDVVDEKFIKVLFCYIPVNTLVFKEFLHFLE